MKDLQDKIGDILYERLSSPFVHSFIVSWLFFNRHLVIYVFMSSGENYIAYKRAVDSMINVRDWLLLPMLGAFFALLIYVGASWVFHNVWEWFVVQKQNSRGRIRKFKVMNSEDEQRLRQLIRDLNVKLFDMEEEFGARLENKDKDMSRMLQTHQHEVGTLTQEIGLKNDRIEHFESEIENQNLLIDALRKNLPNSVLDDEIANGGKIDFSEQRASNLKFRDFDAKQLIEQLNELELRRIFDAFYKIHQNNGGSSEIDEYTYEFMRNVNLIYFNHADGISILTGKGLELKELLISRGY